MNKLACFIIVMMLFPGNKSFGNQTLSVSFTGYQLIWDLDKDLAVVFSPLLPIAFRNQLLDRGYRLVEVPEQEFDTMGCNVLALAPRDCLVTEGSPKTRELLERAGCHVHTYMGHEISVKGGGGPTCLTRPVLRELT